MPSISTILSAGFASAALVHQANGHGYVSQPKPEFKKGSGLQTNYNAEITAVQTGIPAFQGKRFNMDVGHNTETFTAAFEKSGLKSLRELVDKYVTGCGNTIPDTTPRDVTNIKTLTFQNDLYKEGFLKSHQGPCEIWFGDERMFHNDDCAKAYPDYPASIPVDYSKCKGTCMLRFYWLALHVSKWQAMKQCVPIKYGSSGNGTEPTTPSVTAGPTPTTVPVPVTTKPVPRPTTKKPTNAPLPAPSPATPAATSAPKPTKKHCAQRRALKQEN